MSLEKHIREILENTDYKYYESAKEDDNKTIFLLPFKEKENLKIELFLEVNNKAKCLKIFCKDLLNIDGYIKGKLFSEILTINTLLTFGAFGIDPESKTLVYSLGHSLEGKSESYNEFITSSQLVDYISYTLAIVKRIIKWVENCKIQEV